MTWWENAITWGLSILVLGVTIWGIRSNKKDNKKIMRQNAQAEINRIQSEIYQIDREIDRLNAPIQGVYGIYRDVSQTNRISELKARKKNLEQQLKQLKGEIGPACNAGE